ncbi:hypothetical protein QJQ45_022371, partial [Haematococcus lacustris]
LAVSAAIAQLGVSEDEFESLVSSLAGLLAGAGVVFMGASKAESRNHEVWAAGEPAYVKLWLQSPAGLTSTLALEAEEGFAPDLVYCVAAAYLRRCGVACSRLKRFPSLTRPGAVTLQWTMRAMRPTTEEYEKRMRENSSLERVFEYFAQHEKDGVRHMTATDMLAALVCTYPASQSLQDRAGSLAGEPAPISGASASPLPASATSSRAGQSIFESFDVDGDGVLSFPEFQLILTLMAIPQHDISTIFKAGVVDLDGSGSIDAQEFEVIMNQLMGVMQVTPADKHALGRMQRLDTKGGPSGLLLKFFGPELQGKLSLGQLAQFLKQLHDDLVSLEFGHYDVAGTGTIPGLDLARSLAASADLRHTDGLLLKVERLPARLHQAEVALDFLGLVGRPVDLAALDKLVKRVAGVQLSSQVLEITLAVFGDERGLLDAQLLLDTLRNKNLVWRRKGGPGAPSLLQYLMPQW